MTPVSRSWYGFVKHSLADASFEPDTDLHPEALISRQTVLPVQEDFNFNDYQPHSFISPGFQAFFAAAPQAYMNAQPDATVHHPYSHSQVDMYARHQVSGTVPGRLSANSEYATGSLHGNSDLHPEPYLPSTANSQHYLQHTQSAHDAIAHSIFAPVHPSLILSSQSSDDVPESSATPFDMFADSRPGRRSHHSNNNNPFHPTQHLDRNIYVSGLKYRPLILALTS